jgi:NADP-dependent 3-hydroxy acid dehydrogenase YdfG
MATMSWTTDDLGDLSGHLALITGANSGLGLESARALSEHGATVVLACRSRRRAEETRDALLPGARGGLEVLELDLADLASVAAGARWLAESWGRLDLLLNNAGVMALPRSLTRDGFERQFGINHLGHFALTTALLPLLEGRPEARVVTVTSGAHLFGRIAFDDLQGEKRYDRWTAYCQSKLANMMEEATQRFDRMLHKPMLMIEKQMDQQRYLFEQAHKQKDFLEQMFGQLLERQRDELRQFFDRQTQPWVDAQIAPASAGGNHDFTDDTGPDLSPLFVLPALAVLNIGPFAVSCHAKSFKKFVTLQARLYFSGLS